jgi:hypothetical protein
MLGAESDASVAYTAGDGAGRGCPYPCARSSGAQAVDFGVGICGYNIQVHNSLEIGRSSPPLCGWMAESTGSIHLKFEQFLTDQDTAYQVHTNQNPCNDSVFSIQEQGKRNQKFRK